MTLKQLVEEIEKNETHDLILNYYLNSLMNDFVLNEGEIATACKLKSGKPGYNDTIGSNKIAEILSKILNDKNFEETIMSKLENYRNCLRALMNKFSKELGVQTKIPEDNISQTNIKKTLEKYKNKVYQKIKDSISKTTSSLISAISKKNQLNAKNVAMLLQKYESNLLNYFKEILNDLHV